jgi:hypothetical protein
MPWKKSEPMDQRREFALKALRTLNFERCARSMGSAPRWDANGEKGRCGKAWKGWALLGLDRPTPASRGPTSVQKTPRNQKLKQ